MKNKRIKGWQNIDKLYAEYTCKQVIQNSKTECLKGIVYILLVVEGRVRQFFFLICWNCFPKFR